MGQGQRLAALALPLLALAACNAPSAHEEQQRGQAASDSILAADSPVALTPAAQEGDAMLIRGTLVLEDGCIYLRESDGGRILPTFPWPGTSWDAESRTLTILGNHRYRIGDRVEAGGGFVTADGGGRNSAAIQRLLVIPRPRCDTSRVAILYFGNAAAPIR